MKENDLFSNGIYKYAGIELTPSVMAELIVVFFSGKQFKRKDALKKCIDFHRSNGGILEHDNYVQTIKKALASILKAENKGYGVWYVGSVSEETGIVDETENNNDNNQKEAECRDEVRILSDKTIGYGDQSVYVYYYDAYRKLADLEGKNVWECKIGRTDTDPIQRIMSQAGTCYPESPHIALLIYCDNSSILETTFHNIFKMRKKWLKNAPGTEWFLTSPEEIENIYSSIINSDIE